MNGERLDITRVVPRWLGVVVAVVVTIAGVPGVAASGTAEEPDGAEILDVCTSLRKLAAANNPPPRRLDALADRFTALDAEFMAYPLREARTRAQRRRAVEKVGLWCVAREAPGSDGQREPEDSAYRLWEGTFSMESTGADCTSTYDGEVDAAEDGTKAGALMLDLYGSVTCPGKGGFEEFGDAVLFGTFRRARFRLRIESLDPTKPRFKGPRLATACFQNEIVLTVGPAGDATSRYEVSAPSGDVYTCRWDLRCTDTNCPSSKQRPDEDRRP